MRAASLLATLSLLTGCAAVKRGFLQAAGPVAGSEREMLSIIFLVMMLVVVPIWIVTPLFAWHYRLRNTRHAYRPDWGFNWWIEASIWIPPSLIVVGLGWLLWRETNRLDPYKPLALPGPPLQVEAVSLDWKWLFIYPEQHIALIDALILPVGRPVNVSLTSGTVMQSLLIPRLAGQIYAMSGMTTHLNLAAATPGTYLGENTQYNGDGFQAQKFPVTALPEAGFEHWVKAVQQDGQKFDQTAQDKLFARSSPGKPVVYNGVPDDLFDTIRDHYMHGMRASAADQRSASR